MKYNSKSVQIKYSSKTLEIHHRKHTWWCQTTSVFKISPDNFRLFFRKLKSLFTIIINTKDIFMVKMQLCSFQCHKRDTPLSDSLFAQDSFCSKHFSLHQSVYRKATRDKWLWNVYENLWIKPTRNYILTIKTLEHRVKFTQS